MFAECSATWPCGKASGDTPLCFQDVGGVNENGCVTSCTNTNHYENTSMGTGNAMDTGKCTALPCASRTKNGTGSTPCGPGECFWDQGNTGDVTKCITDTTDCTNNNHFTKVGTTNHTCLLLSCTSRTGNGRCVCMCVCMYLYVCGCVRVCVCVCVD